MKRRKILRVSSALFPSMFGKGVRHYEVTRDPLPDDAVVVNARMGDDNQHVVLLIESPEFDPVPDHEVYPEITPHVTQVRD